MEEEISAISAAEVIYVLDNTDTSLVVKIPYEIIRILEEKASEYNGEVKLDMSLGLNEQPISEEAQAILATIYKDYWCDEEKKQEMNKIIEEKRIEYDKEEAERLNPFKTTENEQNSSKITDTNNINENEDSKSDETKALIEVPKKWYIRIFDRIVRFFRKK